MILPATVKIPEFIRFHVSSHTTDAARCGAIIVNWMAATIGDGCTRTAR
jgi:hypothetical protein